MSSSNRKTGSQFLARKSALAIARQNKPKLRDFLIVEDTPLNADRLKATLHSIFGYEITVRQAATLGSALDRVIEQLPDLVFLDDHLKPADNASHTIPLLRRCNFNGHIIVVSGLLDRKRRADLKQAGASIAIHKDDLDSGSISEALATIYDMDPPVTPAGETAGQAPEASNATIAGTHAGDDAPFVPEPRNGSAKSKVTSAPARASPKRRGNSTKI